MPEAGGTSTQAGIYYQNSVAALALSDLLSFDHHVRREQVIEVRVEAPDSVDDLVIRYADGHREFRSVKLSLRKGSKAWINLWKDFGAQQSAPDLRRGDRFSVVIETETSASRLVAGICANAESSTNWAEFRNRSTDAQRKTADDIFDILGSEQKTLDILKRTMVIFLPYIQVEKDFELKKLAKGQHTQHNLFPILRDIVGGEARRRGLFLPATLRRRLHQEPGR